MNDTYPSISNQIKLTNDYILSVDQSIREDKTCLCFAKQSEGEINILGFKYIEKQKDIDKYINMNIKEIYGVFGLSLDELRGENNV